MECKKQYCHNPAANGRIYCSRECAPHGKLCEKGGFNTNFRPGKNGTKAETKVKLEELARQGKTMVEASREIALAYGTIKTYAQKWGIHFSKRKPDNSK